MCVTRYKIIFIILVLLTNRVYITYLFIYFTKINYINVKKIIIIIIVCIYIQTIKVFDTIILFKMIEKFNIVFGITQITNLILKQEKNSMKRGRINSINMALLRILNKIKKDFFKICNILYIFQVCVWGTHFSLCYIFSKFYI